MIWKKINYDNPFRFESDTPFEYDVEKRIPSVSKSKELLGFETEINLSDSLDEVILWMRNKQF